MTATEQPAHETRVIPWVDVSARPEWSDSKVGAYRIWQRLSQWGWEQRHEWRNHDGSTHMESWIRGVPGWLSASEPEA